MSGDGMGLGLRPSALKKASWKGFALRFVFGGAITVVAGLIASRFGPVVGGLFLAFPAILPASVTLIERKEDDRQAGFDSLGASTGALGLAAFGIVVWLVGSRWPAWLALALALIVWLVAALGAWIPLKRLAKEVDPKDSDQDDSPRPRFPFRRLVVNPGRSSGKRL